MTVFNFLGECLKSETGRGGGEAREVDEQYQ